MPIFAPVFRALKEAGASFLVIGGHAVVLRGHLRNTFDLDLLISDSKFAAGRAALVSLGYRTYFQTEAFLQLEAPESLPPLDLMIVDDRTFDRIQDTASEKILDGEQIRVPDVLRLIALKLHATRDTNRRTSEQTGKMWRTCFARPIKILNMLNCRRSFPSMADRLPLLNSGNDLETFDPPEKLKLPTPSETLREWTEQSIDPAMMIAAMEAVMQAARSQPDFEADRLARKTAARFIY